MTAGVRRLCPCGRGVERSSRSGEAQGALQVPLAQSCCCWALLPGSCLSPGMGGDTGGGGPGRGWQHRWGLSWGCGTIVSWGDLESSLPPEPPRPPELSTPALLGLPPPGSSADLGSVPSVHLPGVGPWESLSPPGPRGPPVRNGQSRLRPGGGRGWKDLGGGVLGGHLC